MKFLRILLFPFSIIYGCIGAIRNFFYDRGIFKSHVIPGKSIVVGNLSMGGTGKSPHTLYVWDLLKSTREVAILSRGYGRKTKGLLEVSPNSTSQEVGDEPLMFKKRTQENALVVVAEQRREGVEYIRTKAKDSVIILDDAYQHRKVKAGFSILLTDFNDPYYEDFAFPAGRLREFTWGKDRADCLLVTKCPDNLSDEVKGKMKEKLRFHNQNVFFSKICYGELIPFGLPKMNYSKILLVTGIANPKPLEAYLKRFCEVELLAFPDHHDFTREDLMKIHTKFDTFTTEPAIIVTTEKDFVRLDTLISEEDKNRYPWQYQTITIALDEQEEFNALINSYVDTI